MLGKFNRINITTFLTCFVASWALLAAPSFTLAQEKVRIELIHADHGVGNKKLHPDANIFKGNVHIRHKGMNMYCDSVLFFGTSNSIEAFSNVRMDQGDTLHIYGDYLFYDGVSELAELRDNIRLINREVELTTDSLNFDRQKNLGYYFNGGVLTDPENRLVSDWGQYSVSTKLAKFHKDVRLTNDRAILTSDTLNYDTDSKIVSILGPSEIISSNNHIFSTKGFYNSLTQETFLVDRSKINTDGRIMTGDSLYYNHFKGVGEGYGSVQMVDTIRRNLLEGEFCFYDENNQKALVYDKAMLVDYSQGDSLYIHGDTVRLNTYYIDTDSVFREMRLYNKVRMYKSDMQGVCDSLVYNSKDSCITLYNEPVLWNLNQQLLGEKIMIYMNDSTIDWVHIENQALGVERLDSIHYNQISGNQIKAYFKEGKMDQVDVDGNVMINFYQEERNGILLGLTYAETSLMNMDIKDMQLQKVKMTTATTAVFYPLFLIPEEKLYFKNFTWLDYLRPLNKEDIFNWRTKKPEDMLRESSPEQSESAPIRHVNKRKK